MLKDLQIETRQYQDHLKGDKHNSPGFVRGGSYATKRAFDVMAVREENKSEESNVVLRLRSAWLHECTP